MSLMKILMVVVVIAVIGGLIAAATGVLSMDKDGNMTFNQAELEKQTTASDMSKANLLMGQAKPVEAIALYRSYLEKNPKSEDAPEAMFRIGKCYEDNNQPPEAIKAYKQYLAAFPKDSEDRRNRANSRISFWENAGQKEAK